MVKLSLQKVKDFAKSKNKEFCSNEYIGAEFSYEFKCLDCYGIFKRRYGNFTQNYSCPICKKANRSQYNKLSLSYWQDMAEYRNLTILSHTYVNARTALNWKCNKCHTEFSNSPCNIKAGSGCPKCANGTSIAEERVREIFESKFNKRFPTVRPDFLKNPLTKVNLELDGYCEELKLAFEYDGEFHYKENPYREGALEKQQNLDRLKDKLCKQNQVKLVRIPYTENKRLKEYIDRQLRIIGENNE